MLQTSELAQQLIAAESADERARLISDHAAAADFALAEALKNACYAAWTSDANRVPAIAAALRSLAAFNPAAKIAALSAWTDGIEAIVSSDIAAAVEFLNSAGEIFAAHNDDYQAAQTAVAKLYALALAGRYDEAIAAGKSALAVFISHKDELAAAKIEKNIGNIYIRRQLYPQAAEFFQSAHRRFLQTGNESEIAMSENSLAIVYLVQNDFRTAEKLYRQALNRAAQNNLTVTQAETEANLGNLALFRGRYDEALKFLEKSRAKFAALSMPHQCAVADLEIADVYLELNLLPEARDIYQRIAPQFAALKMRAEEARARINYAKTLAAANENAAPELEKAAALFCSEANPIGAANVKLIQANFAHQSGDFTSARNLAAAAEQDFTAAKSPRHVLLSKLVRGESERCLENFTVAAEILREVFSRAESDEQPQIAWAAAHALGLAEPENAEGYFKTAVEIIEKMRSPLAADEFRTAFFTNKLAPYQELANLCRRDSKRIGESLIWVERARSQALLDLLAGSQRRRQRSNSDDKQAAKLDNLHEELNWFYSRLNRPAAGDISGGEIENLPDEIRRVEREINSLLLQTGAHNENSAAAISNSFNLEKLQNSLGDERILIEFTAFDGEFAAFIVSGEAVELVENLGAAAEIQTILEQIHFQFGALRYGAAQLERHLPQLTRRVQTLLQNLHEILFEPLADLCGGRDLIIVPAGNLNYVPFHALFDGEKYLLESRRVSFAPSAAVLQNLLSRETPHFETVLAVGFADERVPQVETEVRMFENLFADAKILTGESATFAALRENLERERFDVVHLACHGQFRAENPLFSSLHLADGWATVRAAVELNLQNTLVTLSACETGVHEIAAGEELLGLVRGFFAAGANSLVISLWTVNDAATADLMRDFYQNLRQKFAPAAALRNAQLEFVKKDAHPYFWSPFVLTGRSE